ncbi:Glycylpeptide N-tetradecanoyltransferase [Diplocarpon rosae]|nr:Glycylpeptide N-tetradecanoyltransferase [Diplocarpon rosae]
MAPLAPIFKKAYLLLFASIALYSVALIAVTNPWVQRHVIYVHKLHTAWWVDINKPEQFGFAKNQITPFNFSTPDGETIYAWHVMPLGLYAKHEYEILQQPSGCAEDITNTKAFQLLKNDPDARLIINCKSLQLLVSSNAGTVAQGWRTDSYRSLSDGSSSNIHILAIDYRGFGLSSGSPTERGVITDGVAAVNWAMHVAQVPPERIVIVGQSLGTAVTSAVVEHFAEQGADFAGVVLVAGFMSISSLLTQYSILGFVPILAPFGRHPALQRLLASFVVDEWPSERRIANFARLSRRMRLFIVHSKDDPEIPWTQSEGLFAAAANATADGGIDIEFFRKMKARTTVDMGDGSFVSTWKASGDKTIREEILSDPQNSMADESKINASADEQKVSEESTDYPLSTAQLESDNEDDHEDVAPGIAPGTATKKKKSRRKRVKAALGGSSESSGSGSRDEIHKAVGGLGAAQIQEILKMNPALAEQMGMSEGSDMSGKKLEQAVKNLSLEEIMTGLASSGKNVKDMASYKFWQTQPVPKFGESSDPIEEGPFKIVDIEKVPKEPGPLLPGFEWVTMDLTKEEEIQELFALLYGHYVEDDEAMFRFNYSQSYFHRSIDWQKLNDVGFSPCPSNSKPLYQVRKYALPEKTSTKNLRPMETKDIDGVLSLLKRYLDKFDMAPVFTREEVEHWLLNKRADTEDQVVWAYVVEDATTRQVTDFFSFYILESSVINNSHHKNVRAAYLFYYATEHALSPQYSRADLKARLNELMHDALILAKKFKFDVFNALTLLDNTLFLQDQKFGAGDGQLHYYLYNYNMNPIAGGVDAKNNIDEQGGSGVGVVML